MINLCNSYPECHWFESDRRYQRNLRDCEVSQILFCLSGNHLYLPRSSMRYICRHRQKTCENYL